MIYVAIRFNAPSETSDHALERALLHLMKTHQACATFAVIPYAEQCLLLADDVPHLLKALQADNAGKWCRKMIAAQIKAFESVASKALHEFGYDIVTPGAPPSTLVKAAYRLHNLLLTAFWRHTKRLM